MTQKSEAGAIWDRLSKLDVSKHVEKKKDLSYLSWAWAWGVLMDNYPDADFYFESPDGSNAEVFERPEGSCEVRCAVTINGVVRRMWLPVMDHKNHAVIDPSTTEINKAKMRCLVKTLALFGLGFNIYAGEDTADDKPEPQRPQRQRVSREAATRGFKEGNPFESIRIGIETAGTLGELERLWKEAVVEIGAANRSDLMPDFITAKDARKAELIGEQR